ncbi:hypothetical protein GO755_16965 [Spirosoma sp. HMF4905]|uniref:DUF4175 domain-containing protein n=1 Tax=Spirosoma arboris TaxID=2682092 RepID=A0A7K1SD47_9BACT|nr:hypothetical protein [Spirosoma arboris]MVM31742.1 hypothetical protein [Spirosoma arboris]
MHRKTRAQRYDYWHVWALPILLGVLSSIGLLAALIGDDLWDGLSWLCLLIPLVVIGWYVLKAGKRKRV